MSAARDRMLRWVAELEEKGQSRTQIAAAIGCSESGLSRILNGSRGVGGQMAAKIERATEAWPQGPIRAVDWYAPDPAQGSLEATGTEG